MSSVCAALLALGAGVQWVLLLERLVQAATLGWKVADPRVEAGASALGAFLVGSFAAAALGVWLARQPRVPPPARHLARWSARALVAGAALWVGLLASPLVELVRR